MSRKVAIIALLVSLMANIVVIDITNANAGEDKVKIFTVSAFGKRHDKITEKARSLINQQVNEWLAANKDIHVVRIDSDSTITGDARWAVLLTVLIHYY